MEKVESFSQIADLLAAQLQKGVLTNSVLGAAQIDAEAKDGLFVEVSDGQLLLLRDRGTHYVLNFYLQQSAPPHLPVLDKPVILEFPYRPKDEDAARHIMELFCALGFVECLRRTRRTRQAMPLTESGGVRPALPEQAETITTFLQENFSTFTGCLPTRVSLQTALSCGEVLCLEDQAGLAGVLHFSQTRAATELRHLAVRADLRAHGMAGRLLRAYLAATGGQKSQVWATTGYEAAERLYTAYDYQPDGWKSVVLQYKGESL